jgi:hypothetical protein
MDGCGFEVAVRGSSGDPEALGDIAVKRRMRSSVKTALLDLEKSPRDLEELFEPFSYDRLQVSEPVTLDTRKWTRL